MGIFTHWNEGNDTEVSVSVSCKSDERFNAQLYCTDLFSAMSVVDEFIEQTCAKYKIKKAPEDILYSTYKTN